MHDPATPQAPPPADPDVARYALCEAALTEVVVHKLMRPGMRPNHVVAGIVHALRNIGVSEPEIRLSLAALLLVTPEGKHGPVEGAHTVVDQAHALMSLPPGSVSKGGAS